ASRAMEPDLDRRLAELMRMAQDGDPRAYETLLVEVTALVRGFVRKRVRPPDWAEDIAQETLLSIHRNRHTFDPARPFLPGMYAIAKHRLVDFVDKQRRRSENEVSGEGDWENAHAGAEPAGPSLFVQRVLALLSEKQREIIRLLKLEGWSVAEIAAQTGLSEGAVKLT